MSRPRPPSHVQTIRLAKGTQAIPREDPAPHVVVEKTVQVVQVIEPRVVKVLVIPETAALPPVPVSSARARRITDAYLSADDAPRKLYVIA